MKYSLILLALCFSSSALANNPYLSSSGGIEAHGDFNQDGFIDFAIIDSSTDEMNVRLTTARDTYASDVVYSTGASPEAITAIDFNNDGFIDLAVANANDDNVSVFENDGKGNFTLLGTFAAGTNPNAITAADFDADGFQDIAVVNTTDDKVGILMNDPLSPGSFVAQVAYSVGAGSSAGRSIAVADFDLDGRLDIAVTNSADATISTLHNKGAGTFDAQVTYTVGTGTDTTGGLTVGDLNNDGYLDIVNLNSFESTVSVLKNNGTGFDPALHYSVADGGSIGGIVMGDFNEDGDLDAIVTNPGMSSVSVILGRGDGTFDTNVDYSTVSTPKSIVVDDTDADGHYDIRVIAGTASQTFFNGRGDGTFY